MSDFQRSMGVEEAEKKSLAREVTAACKKHKSLLDGEIESLGLSQEEVMIAATTSEHLINMLCDAGYTAKMVLPQIRTDQVMLASVVMLNRIVMAGREAAAANKTASAN